MKINLMDISEEGHDFAFKMGEDAEIDRMVFETIEHLKNFNFSVRIFKTGDIFTADGKFNFQKDDLCSWCAYDIVITVKNKFIEYLMNESFEDQSQKGHAPHNGLNLESTKEVTFVQGYVLDLGEFIREQFAIATPAYPGCPDEKACQERQKENAKHMAEKKPVGHAAFAVLEKLKKQ